MKRLVATLLLLWGLLLVPALCLGELLEHACGCASEAPCGHEASCSSDPCGGLLRPVEESELADQLLRPLLHGPIGACSAHRPLPAWIASSGLPPPRRPNLPYALSDRPLLL